MQSVLRPRMWRAAEHEGSSPTLHFPQTGCPEIALKPWRRLRALSGKICASAAQAHLNRAIAKSWNTSLRVLPTFAKTCIAMQPARQKTLAIRFQIVWRRASCSTPCTHRAWQASMCAQGKQPRIVPRGFRSDRAGRGRTCGEVDIWMCQDLCVAL